MALSPGARGALGAVSGSTMFWNDAPLRIAARKGFRIAVPMAVAASKGLVRGSSGVREKTRAIITGETSAIVKSSDFKAHWWELGIDTHTVGPRNLGRGTGTGLRPRRRKGSTGKGVAIQFQGGDGGFRRFDVPHPGMTARPFLKPMLPMWPGFYATGARMAFSSVGFGI